MSHPCQAPPTLSQRLSTLLLKSTGILKRFSVVQLLATALINGFTTMLPAKTPPGVTHNVLLQVPPNPSQWGYGGGALLRISHPARPALGLLKVISCTHEGLFTFWQAALFSAGS